MHPRPEVRPLRRMLVLFVVLLAMLAIPAQSTDDFPTGPGLDWQFPDSHGMYIVGAGEQTSLDRTLPSETQGNPMEILSLDISQPHKICFQLQVLLQRKRR